MGSQSASIKSKELSNAAVQQAKAAMYLAAEKDRPEAHMNFDFVRRRVKLELALRSLGVDVSGFLKGELSRQKLDIARDG